MLAHRARLGLKTLTETTKDLEVAAWVTEAYVRSHGLAGLSAGASLITGLAEQYWDGVFPLPDDYGVETRVAPVTGLNGRDGGGSLIQPLYKLHVLRSAGWHAGDIFQLSIVRTACRRWTPSAATRASPPAPSRSTTWKRKRAPRVPRRLARLRDQAAAALEAWQAMADVLDEKASEDPPSTCTCATCCGRSTRSAIRYAPPHGGKPTRPPTEAGGSGDRRGGVAAVAAVPAASPPPARTVSREDALKTLETIATFFRRTEPVSPLAYTLDEAMRRARLTWPELLEEIVPDRGIRNAILTSLGIRPPPPPEIVDARATVSPLRLGKL